MKILQSCNYENNRIVEDYKQKVMNEMKNSDNNSRTQSLMFAHFIVVNNHFLLQKEVEEYGKDSLDIELAFDEKDTITDNIQLMITLTKICAINVVLFDEKTKPKSIKYPPTPGRPVVILE